MSADLKPLDLTKLRVIEIIEAPDGLFTVVEIPTRNVRSGHGNGYYTEMELWHTPERCKKPRWDPITVGRGFLDRVPVSIHELETRLYLYDLGTVDAVAIWKAARLRVLHDQLMELTRRVERLALTSAEQAAAAAGDAA